MPVAVHRGHRVWLVYFIRYWGWLPIWGHVAVILRIPRRGFFMLDLVSSRGPRRVEKHAPKKRRLFSRVRAKRLFADVPVHDDAQLAQLIEARTSQLRLVPGYVATRMHTFGRVDRSALYECLRWLARVRRHSGFKYRVFQRSCMSLAAQLLQRLGLPVTTPAMFVMSRDGVVNVTRRTRAGWTSAIQG